MKKIASSFLILVLCSGILFVPVSYSYADETSDIILKLLIKKGVITQEEVDEIKAEVEKEKPAVTAEEPKKEEEKPLLSKIAEAIQPGYAKEGQLKFKGYIQGRYEWYRQSGSHNTFKIKSAYLIPYGTIIPGWDFEVEIDASDSSGKVMRSAFIEYTGFKPYAAVRVGQQKPSYSEEFWTSSSLIDTIERALPVTNLSAERDIGVNVIGKLLDEKIDYGIGVFNGAGINTTDNNDAKDFAGRVVFSPFKGSKGLLDGLSAGGNVWIGKQPQTTFDNTTMKGTRDRFGGLLSYKYGPMRLQSEYLYQTFEKLAGDEKESHGWYVLGTYDLMKDYPNLQLVGKFEQYDADVDVSNNRSDIATLGLNYFFNKYTKIMANYRFKGEENEVRNDEFLTQIQVKY